ncbi:MAG: DUF885 domain-containing protein [Gammaproteobacteria bacterium]
MSCSVSTVMAQQSTAATRAFHALIDEAWESDMRDDPLRASYFGDRRYESQWPDASLAGLAKRNDANIATLARLQRIDRAALSMQDQLSYDLFAQEYRNRVGAYPFKPYLYDVRPRDGLQSLSELAELIPYATVSDYEHWIARLKTIDRYLAQNQSLLEEGIREKRTQPRVIMERVLPQITALTKSSPEDSPFYAPFRRIPESIPQAERARLQAEGKAAIESVVIPAYARFEKFFRERYLPASRATDGIWDTPDGLAFYQERARFHTTTNLTPEQIHQIGLKEVARIRAAMDEVIREVGFKGSFGDFLEFLRTDPQFYYKTPDELFRAYAVLAKQIDPELVKLFRRLPRTPYGVRPIPDTSAPNTTTAYYQGPAIDGSRAGYYYVNLYRPEVRPKYEMEVLTLHEAVPGHHLQISLAQEQSDLPAFRRNAEYTAFVEGWALYTESLGDRLGLYKDPYSRFGQLTYDMWRAVRLVVDTGIHAKHWTRQQAIDYFKANAAKTEADIINEVDRYISWPGQALAYKVGQLRILELRTLAERELGPKFDIRDFHDVVLSSGAVPLDVLERQVKDWIACTTVEKGSAAAR